MTELEFIVECFRRAVHDGIDEPQILRQHCENGFLEVWVGNEDRCLRFVFDVSQGRIDELETGVVVWGLTVPSDDVMLGPADWRLIDAVVQNERLAAIRQHKLVFGSTTFAARAEVDGWIVECQAIGSDQFVEKLGGILESKNLEKVDPGGLRRKWAEANLRSEDGELHAQDWDRL